MDTKEEKPALRKVKKAWIYYALILLIIEKIIQHITVTLAFLFNWKDIQSTVAVDPNFLMISGAVVAVLFVLSLWGMITQKKWAINLIVLLALFDIVGEFIAQGKIGIVITVSILVAVFLLMLALLYQQSSPLKTSS
jgi:hypothetical protein